MQKKYGGTLIYKTRDEWGEIEVVEDAFHRSLHFGTEPKQSSMRLDDPDALVISYTRAMMSALLFQEQPRSALLLGLGGGSLAKFLLHHFPACRVDVVELREAVCEVAREQFQLRPDPRLNIHIGDAGEFMREADPMRYGNYDLILIDAYDHKGMCASVDGLAFFDACRQRLAHGGVLSTNLWLDFENGVGRSLEAIKTSFDGNLLRLPVPGKGNIIGLAFDQPVTRRQLKQLTPRALELGRRYNLELPALLHELRKHNRRFWF